VTARQAKTASKQGAEGFASGSIRNDAVGSFGPVTAMRRPCRAGPDASYRLREAAMVLLICPTCQIVVAGMTIDHAATVHGVVFDIFWWERLSRGL
jgi:hypothetical protein